jgi:hypothetical protein
VGTRGSFSGGKATEALTISTSCRDQECVVLHLHSPNTPYWRGAQGTTLLLPFTVSQFSFLFLFSPSISITSVCCAIFLYLCYLDTYQVQVRWNSVISRLIRHSLYAQSTVIGNAAKWYQSANRIVTPHEFVYLLWSAVNRTGHKYKLAMKRCRWRQGWPSDRHFCQRMKI